DAPLLPIVSPLALVSHDAGIAPAGVNITAVPVATGGGLLASGGLILPEDGVMLLSDAPQLLNLASGITALTFSGLPAGAALSAGTHNANGTWTLTPAQLTNLSLSLPANSD